jgi:hypothetical protein
LEKLDMRNLPRILIATALSMLVVSTAAVTTWAANDDEVQTSSAPYKPGRQLDDESSADKSDTAQSPRELDDGGQPVEPSRPPYKPGREADDAKNAGDSATN